MSHWYWAPKAIWISSPTRAVTDFRSSASVISIRLGGLDGTGDRTELAGDPSGGDGLPPDAAKPPQAWANTSVSGSTRRASERMSEKRRWARTGSTAVVVINVCPAR